MKTPRKLKHGFTVDQIGCMVYGELVNTNPELVEERLKKREEELYETALRELPEAEARKYVDEVFRWVKNKLEEKPRVKLFVGSGKVEKEAKQLMEKLENTGYRVVIVPISDEGVLELSSGGFMYSGPELEMVESVLGAVSKILKERKRDRRILGNMLTT